MSKSIFELFNEQNPKAEQHAVDEKVVLREPETEAEKIVEKTEPKPEPKTEPKPEPKTEPETAPTPEPKSEPVPTYNKESEVNNNV